MWTARRSIAALLAALWLVPVLAACAIGLHVLLEHAPDDHLHAHHEPHDHGSAEHESNVNAVALHGHYHGHAGAADHSHDVTFSPAKLLQRTNLVLQSVTHLALSPSASPEPRRLPANIGRTLDHASPALFTAHCSLLI